MGISGESFTLVFITKIKLFKIKEICFFSLCFEKVYVDFLGL